MQQLELLVCGGDHLNQELLFVFFLQSQQLNALVDEGYEKLYGHSLCLSQKMVLGDWWVEYRACKSVRSVYHTHHQTKIRPPETAASQLSLVEAVATADWAR